MKHKIFITIALLCLEITMTAQVGIGTDSPNAAAILEVHSIDKGILLPRLSSQNIENMNAVAGLMVYCTDCNTKGSLKIHDGDEWIDYVPSSGGSFSDNVGIGTTSPSAKLDVVGSGINATDKATMRSQSVFRVKPHADNSGNLNFAQVDNGHSIGLQYTNDIGTADWDISLQPFGGNVGIGTTQPRHKLDVFTGTGLTHFQTYTYGAEVVVGTENQDTEGWARSVRFRSIGNEASNFAASIGAYTIKRAAGYLFLNSQFDISQGSGVGYHNSQFKLYTNGNVTLTGTLTQGTSDRRLKDNLTVISDAIKKVNKLSGYEYDWKAPAPLTGHDVGLIAQEVQTVYPEAVKPAPFDRKVNADGQEVSKSGNNYLTVQYEKLVPLLVQAIKEQQQQIETLHKEIEKLKKQ